MGAKQAPLVGYSSSSFFSKSAVEGAAGASFESLSESLMTNRRDPKTTFPWMLSTWGAVFADSET